MSAIRLAFRHVARRPGFAVLVALTLALGIGGTSAIFSVVKAVLLDGPPYADPGRLVLVWQELRAQHVARAPGSAYELRELRARARTLARVAGIWAGSGTFAGDGDPEQVKVGFVTGELFDVLGARPLLGRAIGPADEGNGKPRVIVLDHGFWQRRYGGDPAVLGRTVRFDGDSATVVGVMPPDFRMVFPPDAQVPPAIQAYASFPGDIYEAPPDVHYLRFVGRLAPGVTVAAADAEVAAIGRALAAERVELGRDQIGFRAVAMQADAVRDVRGALLALLAGVVLVLLISCVNVANLLLARAAARRHEMSVRAALGASRARLVRQLLLESLILAAAGGLCGVLLGAFCLDWLAALAPPGVLPPRPLVLDRGVLLFAAALTAGSGVLFGTAPALAASRVDLAGALRATGPGATAATGRRSRAVLVVAEMALGFVLLVGAGLMARTFVAVGRVDPGLDAEGALTFELSLPFRRFDSDEKRVAFARRLEHDLRALPGAAAAGAISHLPLDDYPNWYSPYGLPGGPPAERKMADHRAVTAGYLEALGARLVRGRLLGDGDGAGVVIDELVAADLWPGQDPLGRFLEHEAFASGEFVYRKAQVVGVVRHVQQRDLVTRPRGQIYILHASSPREHLSFVVRAAAGVDPSSLAGAARRAVAALDPELALAKVRPLAFYVDRAMRPARFTMVLGTLFGGLAVLLAAIGIYGVVATSVSQRQRELSLRLALGARPGVVTRMVLGEGLVLAIAGLALGALAAGLLAGLLGKLLFGVGPLDPLTYALAAVILPAAALLACWLPARRAGRQSPMMALRAE